MKKLIAVLALTLASTAQAQQEPKQLWLIDHDNIACTQIHNHTIEDIIARAQATFGPRNVEAEVQHIPGHGPMMIVAMGTSQGARFSHYTATRAACLAALPAVIETMRTLYAIYGRR